MFQSEHEEAELTTGTSIVATAASTKAAPGRVALFAKPGATLELVTRDLPEPGPREVRIRVHACGVCHSDSLVQHGLFPGITYPRVPGHEVIGVIDALGPDVLDHKVGQRVGVGWYGGHCGRCEPCRRGELVLCERLTIPGITTDGGYADYMIARELALVTIPDSLATAEAAPVLCAGVTTFNALRNSGAKSPDIVAVLGIGGLGHLAVQYAAKLGFRTVAIARGQDKAAFARELGACHFIDSTKEDVAKALLALGGAKVILSTVTDSDAMSAAVGGLGLTGVFMVIGASGDPIKVSPIQLIMREQSMKGWASGAAIDSEDTLKFTELSGVRTMIERYPLDRAVEAYDRMMSGKARFRVVIESGA
jgi:D-arabinose 1-dehydrogenase-like Zn-dependent alcohol dehydrogenase